MFLFVGDLLAGLVLCTMLFADGVFSFLFIFEMFSSFLEWVVKRQAGWASVLHYLEDFLSMGQVGSRVSSIWKICPGSLWSP